VLQQLRATTTSPTARLADAAGNAGEQQRLGIESIEQQRRGGRRRDLADARQREHDRRLSSVPCGMRAAPRRACAARAAPAAARAAPRASR
jgi:hypothetical protein